MVFGLLVKNRSEGFVLKADGDIKQTEGDVDGTEVGECNITSGFDNKKKKE